MEKGVDWFSDVEGGLFSCLLIDLENRVFGLKNKELAKDEKVG